MTEPTTEAAIERLELALQKVLDGQPYFTCDPQDVRDVLDRLARLHTAARPFINLTKHATNVSTAVWGELRSSLDLAALPVAAPRQSCDGTGTIETVHGSLIGNPPERDVERCGACNGTGRAALPVAHDPEPGTVVDHEGRVWAVIGYWAENPMDGAAVPILSPLPAPSAKWCEGGYLGFSAPRFGPDTAPCPRCGKKVVVNRTTGGFRRHLAAQLATPEPDR